MLITVVSITSLKWWPSAILLHPSSLALLYRWPRRVGHRDSRDSFRYCWQRKDVALEDGHRDVQQLGIGLDLLAVDLIVAGVHHQKDQLKGNIAVFLQLLHQLCHQHGVFAARDADGDLVSLLYQLVALYRHDKGVHSSLRYFLMILRSII